MFSHSFHCSEQGLVRSSLRLFSLRPKNEPKNQILRMRLEARLQEMLREVSQRVKKPSEEAAWGRPSKGTNASGISMFNIKLQGSDLIIANMGSGLMELNWSKKWEIIFRRIIFKMGKTMFFLLKLEFTQLVWQEQIYLTMEI